MLLVDTGATKTTMLDSDARRLGIPYAKLSPLKQPLLGIGGTVETFVAKDVSIYFKAADSSEHKEDLEELLVVKHSRLGENIMRIPSVLGRDVLNKYHVIYDKCNQLVSITDELPIEKP